MTASFSNKHNNISQIEKIPKTPELIISEDNLDVSVLNGLDSSLESVKPEKTNSLQKE